MASRYRGDRAGGTTRIAFGRTTVPLHLDQRESVFVVFRRAASSPSRTLLAHATTTLATLSGPWDVAFPPNLGAPEKIQLAKPGILDGKFQMRV